MTTAPEGIPREERDALAGYLAENLAGPLAIDVWTRKESALIRTDRDPCTHCDETVLVARQFAALHPSLSITLYDLDRHAARAAEAGIDRPPVTVFRGAGGRELRIAGMWSGLLFPAVLEAATMLSSGASPLSEESRATLAAIDSEVRIEVLGTPYDPYSAFMLRFAAALAVESRHVHAQFVEASEFPLLAAARGVTEVPVVVVNGRRSLGAWDEAHFIEHIGRVLAGDETTVVRDRVLTAPFYTEQELEAQAATDPGDQPPPTTPSGLILPGR